MTFNLKFLSLSFVFKYRELLIIINLIVENWWKFEEKSETEKLYKILTTHDKFLLIFDWIFSTNRVSLIILTEKH